MTPADRLIREARARMRKAAAVLDAVKVEVRAARRALRQHPDYRRNAPVQELTLPTWLDACLDSATKQAGLDEAPAHLRVDARTASDTLRRFKAQDRRDAARFARTEGLAKAA